MQEQQVGYGPINTSLVKLQGGNLHRRGKPLEMSCYKLLHDIVSPEAVNLSKDILLQDSTVFSDCDKHNEQQRKGKNLGSERGAEMRVSSVTGVHPKPMLKQV